jgi:photosystem II stability/assembly factor-like uncharacterized protein
MKLLSVVSRWVAIGALVVGVQNVLAFQNVLDTAALQSRLAAIGMLSAVAQVGDHFVAVGPRGHVLVSEKDQWKQASVPVSADLTAVHFVSSTVGWAVGHGATILRTQDGGMSWTKQLDGRVAARLMLSQYKNSAQQGDRAGSTALAEAERFSQEGPGRPLLGVWFLNEKVGFVVGAFNLIFKTEDGGETWVSWFHRTDNPKLSNLYSVTGDERHVYIAGEQGLLLRLSDDKKRFESLPTEYKGSYFGALIPKPGSLMVYGMRGNVYVTNDDGAHWERIISNDPAGIVGGTPLGNGKALLVSQSGHMYLYDGEQNQLKSLKANSPMSYTGVASTANGQLTLVGFNGAKFESLASSVPMNQDGK